MGIMFDPSGTFASMCIANKGCRHSANINLTGAIFIRVCMPLCCKQKGVEIELSITRKYPEELAGG